MREAKIIKKTPVPRTIDSLAGDLRRLGWRKARGIVHSSLSAIGWVCGESVADPGAHGRRDRRGDDRHAAQTRCAIPRWINPPVPPEWIDTIRDTMPAYQFRLRLRIVRRRYISKRPGVFRSAHPSGTWRHGAGMRARDDPPDYRFQPGRKLAARPVLRPRRTGAHVGTGYDTCTSLHLAEYRVPGGSRRKEGAPIMKDGRRQTYEDLELNCDLFPEIGVEFERRARVNKGLVGSAESRLFRQREAVDFAVEWLKAHNKSPEAGAYARACVCRTIDRRRCSSRAESKFFITGRRKMHTS